MKPCIIKLCNQMLSLAIARSFHTFHPHSPQQAPNICITSYLINCMQRKCISAVFWQNPIKHPPDIEQMYSAVSIGLPQVESSTRFSQALLKQGFLTFHYSNSSFCCLPIFISSLQLPKRPPNNTKHFNRSWQGSSPVAFLLQTKFPF